MNRKALEDLLDQVASGATPVDTALGRLSGFPVEEADFARIDHQRALRCGFPEVVLCEGKTPAQCAEIIRRLAARGGSVLATRASAEVAEITREKVPEIQFDEMARLLYLDRGEAPRGVGRVLVLTAGTSDLPIAAEAARVLSVMGNESAVISDVGVAGIHRLVGVRDEIEAARVLIVVAGMEGALASVVGGLVRVPVIAVPTSVGYGASFSGLAALLGMLSSCAAGVTVVNIDNGFGAAYAASLINHLPPENRG